jgi:RHS repeat-associated protein
MKASRVLLVVLFSFGLSVGLSATIATPALASAEWLLEGMSIPSTAKAHGESTGTILLRDIKEKSQIECHFTEAWADWLQFGDITEATASLCKTHEGLCTSPTVTTVDLPWLSELVTGGSEIRDKLLANGKGEPGWTVKCLVIGLEVTDMCKGETAESAMENLVEGDVLATFNQGGIFKCSLGGANQGEIKGELKNATLEKLPITVSGAPAGPLQGEQYGSGPNPASPKIPKCKCGESVDGATGNETKQQTDISIGGRGPGLRIVRSYNGLAAAEAKEAGPWGFGWTGSYDASLEINSEKGTATVHQDNGSSVTFFKSGEAYTPAGWTEAKLVKEGTNYIYTLPSQLKLEFNSLGRLTKETERNGNANTFTYNGSNQLEKVTDGDSRTLTFKYNGEGLVESVTDPMGHVVSYTYSSKQLASVTIEGKVRWEFEYESPHLLKKITDGRKHAVTIEYDGNHRVIKEVKAGHERKWKYGSTPGTETTLTEPNSSETVETFNAAGEPTKIVRAKGTSVETTTEYEYNAISYNLTKLIDPDKHETTYGYDSEGNKITETDPNKDERKWTYGKKHDVETETTPEGEKTTIKLNGNGDPEKIERSIGTETQKTEYKYDEKGDLTEVVDPLKRVTKYTYDAAGDKEDLIEPEKNEWTWSYNNDSQVTSEVNALGNNPGAEKSRYTTKIEPNEQGHPLKITDPLGHTTEYKYDANGNIESVTDGNKHIVKYEYNEENLPIKVEEPNKTVVETGYDAEGQRTSRTDGNKHVWEYKRNQLEQITEEKNPLGKVWKKKYEKAGNLESLEDPEKHTTEYKYDESNRLKTIKYSTGKPSEVTYEYNKDGKVTKMKDETGTTTNTYDKLDRLTEAENGAKKIVKYEYDLDNEPIKITYPNGKAVTRGYDQDGRLTNVTDWNSKVTKFTYNLDSSLTLISFPSETGDKDEFRVNEANQLLEIKMMKGTETLGKLLYTRGHDAEVTKTTTTTLPGPEVNEDKYDENSRLTEDNKQAYEYDKANNPTKLEGTGTYSYNEADQLKEGPVATYTYNEDGRRAESKPKSGEPATTYTYNLAGNLTSVERAKGTRESEIKDSYTYDGNDLRQAQTINGAKTNLTWDTAEQLPLILEDETNSYIYGAENLPIEQISTSGVTLYLHHDQQGSTRLLTNKEGKTEATYTYNPYGTVNATAGTASTPLRYDAQYTSTDTGLIYLRNRIYDPATAQFITVDPMLVSTNEPYVYASDDPLNQSDPSGTASIITSSGPSDSGYNIYTGASYNFSGGAYTYFGGVGSLGPIITSSGPIYYSYDPYTGFYNYFFAGTYTYLGGVGSLGPIVISSGPTYFGFNPYTGFYYYFFGGSYTYFGGGGSLGPIITSSGPTYGGFDPVTGTYSSGCGGTFTYFGGL